MPANNIFSLLYLCFDSNSLITRKIGQIDIFEDLNKDIPSVFDKKEMLSVLDKNPSSSKCFS